MRSSRDRKKVFVIAKQVLWSKIILEEFVRLATLTPDEEHVLRTRVSGWTRVKVGYISKSYKLKKDIVEAFAEACKKNGISQAAAISKFMQQYINENKSK